MQSLKCITRGAFAALALSAGLAAMPATAQPRHHGGDFLQHLETVKAQLNLNTQQQGMWDAAVASGKSAREAAHARHATIKAAVAEEAGKPTPSLARIAATTDGVHDADLAARRAVREHWLALYATFNADQIAVVKGLLSNRLERMASFRERMLQRFGKQ